MSLLFMDGFEAQDTLTKWAVNLLTPEYTQTTRLGSGVCLANSGGSAGASAVVGFTASARVYAGAAVKVPTLTNRSLLALCGDAGATQHAVLVVNASGAVTINRGGTVLATSTAGLIPAGTWVYVELTATVSDTVGVMEARVNGTVVATFTGDTKNAGTGTNLDALTIFPSSSSSPTFYDDVYVCNALGSVNNTYLGDVRVQTLRPNAAGSSTQLTPVGSASNYANVDEAPPSQADYNYSGTAGQKDLYGVEDVLGGTTAVLGVQVGTVARKTDTGARSMKNLIKSGATTTAGSTATLGVSALTYLTMHEANPTTAAAWAVSDIAALEVGVEVV